MAYSKERRAAVIAKMQPPDRLSIPSLSREEGISEATLYKWRSEARAQRRLAQDAVAPAGWTSRDKFAAVVETASLNAEALAAYCRERGLCPEQIAAWRAAFNDWARETAAGQFRLSRKDRKRVRELERELARKEKALAEAAALLTLRKKAAAIWGERTHDQRPGSPRDVVADLGCADRRRAAVRGERRAGAERAAYNGGPGRTGLLEHCYRLQAGRGAQEGRDLLLPQPGEGVGLAAAVPSVATARRGQARILLGAMASAGAEARHGGGRLLRVFLAKGYVKPVLLVVDGPAGHPILFLVVEDRTILTAVTANGAGKTRARVGGKQRPRARNGSV